MWVKRVLFSWSCFSSAGMLCPVSTAVELATARIRAFRVRGLLFRVFVWGMLRFRQGLESFYAEPLAGESRSVLCPTQLAPPLPCMAA